MSDHSRSGTDVGDIVTVWLPPLVTAPGMARAAVAAMTSSAPFETRTAVELVVSELVTNCVKHAGLGPDDRIGLVAMRSRPFVRVEVWDGGPGFEPRVPTSASLSRETGWGLYLVDRLADRWGVEIGEGTRVWSEFDL